MEHLREFAGVRIDEPDAGPRAAGVLLQAGRAGLSPAAYAEQRRLFVDRQFERRRDPELAMKRVVLLMLKSPRFLYREVGAPTAGRLTTSLADVVRPVGFAPDDELLKARRGRAN